MIAHNYERVWLSQGIKKGRHVLDEICKNYGLLWAR
jgi:hypothetical protein